MNDAQKAELGELQNLQSQGTLDDAQTARLAELNGLKAQAEKTAAEEAKSKELESALAQKAHFREKLEKAEADKKALEDKLTELNKTGSKTALGVDDFIDISTSLEGLDQREKEYVAREHKLSGKPIKEVRENEDFKLWQSAYRTKVEKENALRPSAKQPEGERTRTFDDQLRDAKTLEEKEKLLTEVGLYKQNKPRADRTNIGGPRTG